MSWTLRSVVAVVTASAAIGCTDTEAEKAAAKHEAEQAGKDFIDAAIPGGNAFVNKLQAQAEWKKQHNLTTEQVDQLYFRWCDAQPDGASTDVSDFWTVALKTTPAELEASLPSQ